MAVNSIPPEMKGNVFHYWWVDSQVSVELFFSAKFSSQSERSSETIAKQMFRKCHLDPRSSEQLFATQALSSKKRWNRQRLIEFEIWELVRRRKRELVKQGSKFWAKLTNTFKARGESLSNHNLDPDKKCYWWSFPKFEGLNHRLISVWTPLEETTRV